MTVMPTVIQQLLPAAWLWRLLYNRIWDADYHNCLLIAVSTKSK